MKRSADVPAGEYHTLQLRPLGAGKEVGRSCLILRYKGLTVMLDCGVLPKFKGEESLPLLRQIDPAEIDVVIITCVWRGARDTRAAAARAHAAPLPSGTSTWTTAPRCRTLRSAWRASAGASSRRTRRSR